MDIFRIFAQRHAVLLSRIAIAVVYFWFGVLKFIGASPAEPLVEELFEKTLAWAMPFSMFYALFAVFEMAIGILILIKKFDRVTILLIGAHLITTALPLFVLPAATWSGFLIPTLVGQYILKNVLIVSAVVTIAGATSETQKAVPNS